MVHNRPSCNRQLAADCMEHRKATCTIQARADQTQTNALDQAALLAHVHAHARMPTPAWWPAARGRVVWQALESVSARMRESENSLNESATQNLAKVSKRFKTDEKKIADLETKTSTIQQVWDSH